MSKVYITDYFKVQDVEREILGDNLSDMPTEEVEVLLVWHEEINESYIKQFPNLKGVVRYGVGYDTLDLELLASKNIYACNTPDYGVDEVSDTAIAMIMNIARGVSQYNSLAKHLSKDWQENVLQGIKRSNQYKLGVIGAGRIGGSVLIKAKSLRFQTCFYDPYKPSGHEKIFDSQRVDKLEDLLKWSDIVSINIPLNKETKGLVNADFIKNMNPGSSIVNTARGGLIEDIDVFYKPLKRGYLANVALDVLPEEPPGPSKLLDDWRSHERWLNGRLIINPHTAYYSKSAYQEMRVKAAKNAIRIMKGMVPWNIIEE